MSSFRLLTTGTRFPVFIIVQEHWCPRSVVAHCMGAMCGDIDMDSGAPAPGSRSPFHLPSFVTLANVIDLSKP